MKLHLESGPKYFVGVLLGLKAWEKSKPATVIDRRYRLHLRTECDGYH